MKLALYSAALDTQSKEAAKDNQAEAEAKELAPLLAMTHGQLTVKAHSDWADKTSKKGFPTARAAHRSPSSVTASRFRSI